MSAGQVVADLYRTVSVIRREGWGTCMFIDEHGNRCLLGAIAEAVNPGDPDGDPTRIADPLLQLRAMRVVATIERELAYRLALPGPQFVDIGTWNDAPYRTEHEVVLLLMRLANAITDGECPTCHGDGGLIDTDPVTGAPEAVGTCPTCTGAGWRR